MERKGAVNSLTGPQRASEKLRDLHILSSIHSHRFILPAPTTPMLSPFPHLSLTCNLAGDKTLTSSFSFQKEESPVFPPHNSPDLDFYRNFLLPTVPRFILLFFPNLVVDRFVGQTFPFNPFKEWPFTKPSRFSDICKGKATSFFTRVFFSLD